MNSQTAKVRFRLRHDLALLIAGTLYGVIAVLTALIAVQPGEVTTWDAIVGGLVLAGITVMSKFFIELSKKETELGARLNQPARRELWREALPACAFPLASVVVLGLAHALGIGQAAAYNLVYYLGLATLFAAGFLSRYTADAKPSDAFSRGLVWLFLGLLILAGKKFV
jgi:hypothetical protein